MNETKKRYWPLLALLLVGLLMALALASRDMSSFMRFFMGCILSLLALVKIFDLGGFMLAFEEYDLLAKAVPKYGFFYPFIELLLGLGFLSNVALFFTSLITFIVMAFGAVGVIIALRQKKKLTCACMGNLLQVPLSVVSLSEDIAMGLMSLGMLLF